MAPPYLVIESKLGERGRSTLSIPPRPSFLGQRTVLERTVRYGRSHSLQPRARQMIFSFLSNRPGGGDERDSRGRLKATACDRTGTPPQRLVTKPGPLFGVRSVPCFSSLRQRRQALHIKFPVVCAAGLRPSARSQQWSSASRFGVFLGGAAPSHSAQYQPRRLFGVGVARDGFSLGAPISPPPLSDDLGSPVFPLRCDDLCFGNGCNSEIDAGMADHRVQSGATTRLPSWP